MLEKLKVPADGLEARGRLMYNDYGKILPLLYCFCIQSLWLHQTLLICINNAMGKTS